MAFAAIDHQKRIAISRRTHDRFGGDIVVGAWPALDDEWLAEALRQPLTQQARQGVVRAASRITNDKAHRPHRITLCPCETRDEWESGSTRC